MRIKRTGLRCDIYRLQKCVFANKKGHPACSCTENRKSKDKHVSKTVLGGGIQILEGGVIPAFVGPLLQGAALLSAVGGACNVHRFLESRVENAGYAMAYEAEMSRIMKEKSGQ